MMEPTVPPGLTIPLEACLLKSRKLINNSTIIVSTARAGTQTNIIACLLVVARLKLKKEYDLQCFSKN
uniref:Uncharacterized protein n=1 Tax=Anguilla anguilla TaxID=7936 RepID=A0A0E9WMZ2_ANGAN